MAPLTRFLSLSLLASAASATCKRTCVVPSSSGTASDSEAIEDTFSKCSKDSTIVFTEGVDYNVFEPIKAEGLSNVVISMKGNLHLPQDVPGVQQMVADAGGRIDWFTFRGTNVQWIGSEDITKGWIYSYGQAWYDANPPGETGADGRPHLMKFAIDNAYMKHFKSAKPIAWGVSLSGDNITVSNAVVDAVSESGAFPFNTDAFDVGGTGITIEDSVMYNGDDAIAVGDGCHDILFRRNTIGYQTHGMSIGSLGRDQTKFVNVSNIRFEDVTVAGGLYAARFKSWVGGQGLVKDVSWSNIRLYNVSFPIFVTQTYGDQNRDDDGTGRPNNSSVNMENLSWTDFTGSINTFNPGDGSCASDPCWYDVGLPNLEHNEAVIIKCNTETSCKNFELKDINVYPQDMSAPTVICKNAQPELNPNFGIECRDGPYDPL